MWKQVPFPISVQLSRGDQFDSECDWDEMGFCDKDKVTVQEARERKPHFRINNKLLSCGDLVKL